VSSENTQAQTDQLPDPTNPPPPPSATKLANWAATAARRLVDYYPPKQAIVIPAGATLMPTSPWDVDTLTPGAWFQITIDYICRPPVTDWQRIETVAVTESGDGGETVQFTAATAPSRKTDPV